MKLEIEKSYLNKLKRKFKFHKKSYQLFVNHINCFKEAENNFRILKHSYKIGDDVYLKKETFMHGTRK